MMFFSGFPNCTKLDKELLHKISEPFIDGSVNSVYKLTGCLPMCRKAHYKLERYTDLRSRFVGLQ